MISSLSKKLYAFLMYVIMYFPLVFTMVYSFNDSRYSVEWRGFTLKWYHGLLQNTSLMDVALNSLLLAISSATAATFIGALIAFSIYRYTFIGRQWLTSSLYIVMMSPEIIMAISFVMLFIVLGIPKGYITLLLSHTAFCFPFVTATVLARLHGFNKHLLEAAQDLGANEGKAMMYIIIPMIFPALLAGWLMSFTLSLDDVIISFFVTGPSFDVLPVKIHSMVRTGVKPDVNALCTVMFCFTLCMVFLSYFLAWRKK